MATTSLEQRVAALEADVGRLKQQFATRKSGVAAPWWEKIYGTFADSPEYEEAMRLGRAYRESLRPQEDEPTRR